MDLRDYPITPKCRQNRSLLSSKKKTKLKEYSEESIIPIENYSSESEHEYFTPKRAKDESKTDNTIKFNDVRSTPAGSPIMGKKLPTAKKKLKANGNLVPISPITPGVAANKSSFLQSCISLHVTDNEWKTTSFDNTVLAVPLDQSDGEDSLSPELTLNPNKQFKVLDEDCIESPQQTQNTDAISQVSSICEEGAFSVNPTATNTLRSKGSSWLESVCDIREQERKMEEKSICDKQNTQLCDSAKKVKFKKGGLAEQLTKLLKKESTEHAIFYHQVKSKQCTVESLKLQIISNHCEGSLHVLECKNLSTDNGKEFYTLLLQKKTVAKHELKLTTKFTVYFPWYELQLESQMYPVLISANKIFAVEENELDNKTMHEDEQASLYHESLLTAFEHQRTIGFVSVVSTVQRIWKKVNADDKTISWSLLLEDAFGVFMEVGIGEEALKNSDNILAHGEGHRVVMHNAAVEGRVTKTQCPPLFGIIESVWRESGQGLMHVSQSQSQEIDGSQSAHKIQPPSFCYILTLNTMHAQITFVHSPSQQNNSITTTSLLNRPRFDQLSKFDVLYREPVVATLNNARNSRGRISVICKLVFHFQIIGEQEQETEPKCSYIKCLVVDLSSDSLCEVRILPSCFIQDDCYGAGEVIVLKDVSVKADDLHLDCYSRIFRLIPENVDDIAYNIMLGADILLEKYVEMKKVKMKDKVSTFKSETTPQTLATVDGVLRKVAYTCNNSMHCFHCGNDDLLNSQDHCQRCGNEMLFKGSKSPCLLLEAHTGYKVVVKVIRETWTDLTRNCSKIENLKELYGTHIGPLMCCVTQNSSGIVPQLNEIVL